MDSSWRHCPYCAREQQASKDKSAAAKPAAMEAPMAEPRERQHTRVQHDGTPSLNRKTEFYPGVEPAAVPQGDNRRIVGVMISYTWDQVGELYPVRQGRTHIGSGEIRGENRPADVCCPQDTELSADHAMILVQGGANFFIQDLSSLNGTALNGTQIRPELPEPLPSPAEIKVGETTFTFVRFDVAPGAPVVRAEETPKPAVRQSTVLPR
jgi:hypothetical protein